jgi:hypothetical protein
MTFDHRHDQTSSLTLAGRGIGIGASPTRRADGGVGLGAEEWRAVAAWRSSRTALRCAHREEASARLLGAPGTSEGRLWRWGPAAFKLSGDEDGDLMARLAQAGCAA